MRLHDHEFSQMVVMSSEIAELRKVNMALEKQVSDLLKDIENLKQNEEAMTRKIIELHKQINENGWNSK